MERMFSGDIYSEMDVNDDNLEEARYKAMTELQRSLMQEFVKGSPDRTAAARAWINTHSQDFRALLDSEPEILTRYMKGEAGVAEEIKRRLIH